VEEGVDPGVGQDERDLLEVLEDVGRVGHADAQHAARWNVLDHPPEELDDLGRREAEVKAEKNICYLISTLILSSRKKFLIILYISWEKVHCYGRGHY